MARRLLLGFGAAFFAVFLLLPLGSLLFRASLGSVPWKLLASNFWQAFLSASFSLALGIPFAYALNRRTPFRSLLRTLSLVPLVLPQPAMILSLVVLFGSRGFISLPFPLFGLEGVVLAHALYNFPLAGRILASALGTQSPLEGVARSLGAGRLQTLGRVSLPLFFPALLGAFAVAFAFSFTSFAIPLVFGGVSFPTVEVEIFRSLFRDFDAGRAAFLALLQLLVFLPFALAWRAGSLVSPSRKAGRDSPPARLLSFLFLVLLSAVLLGPLVRFQPAAFSLAPVWNSVALASLAAALSVGVWVAGGPALGRYAFLLFGVSPLVLAVAYAGFPQGFFLVAVGHAFLAFALVAVCLLPLAPGMRRLSSVAASLGASPSRQFLRVVLPAYAPAFLTAFLLAFGFSLGESGFVLSSGGGLQTLSSLSVAAFASYRFAAGYFYVLVLTLLAVLLSFVVDRLGILGSPR